MFIKRFITGFLICMVVWIMPGISQANENLSITYRYWLPNMDAKIGTAEIGGNHYEYIDAEETFGLKEENIGDLQLSWQMDDRNQVRLGYLDTSFKGTGTPTGTIAGVIFTGGEIETKFSIENIQAEWVKYLPSDVDHDTRFAVVGGIRSLRINATSEGLPERNFNKVFPTIGFAVETGIGSPVSGFINFSGAYAGNKGYFYDADAGLKAYLDKKKNTSVTVGYRMLKINADKNSDEKFDAKLTGPFFSASVRF